MLDFGRRRGLSSFDANRIRHDAGRQSDGCVESRTAGLDMPAIGIKATGSLGQGEIKHQLPQRRPQRRRADGATRSRAIGLSP